MNHQHPCNHYSRRELLTMASCSFGALALSGLMHSKSFGDQLTTNNTLATGVKPIGHHPAKATSVIFLYMDGGVSHVDAFDPKPALTQYEGQSTDGFFTAEPTQFDSIGKFFQSPWKFNRYGECGMPISDLFPHIGSCADDLCMIRSMYSEFPEHTNANYFLHTGHGLQGRPSMGSWCNYGLGSFNDNLPGFIVLNGGLIPPGGLSNFDSGFLPATHQGSIFKAGAEPLSNINPFGDNPALQQKKLKYIDQLDQFLLGKIGQDNNIESSIKNYELAYRMQTAVPELTDMQDETESTKTLYGINSENKDTQKYGQQCLLARRLVERGVRFIEVTCGDLQSDRWDQHTQLRKRHKNNAQMVDQPIAGLLRDLKSRGLLESTLVVFSGEFGRTPFAQGGGNDGRDHNPQGFSMWMAGGGIQGGTIYGATDEFGYHAIENRVSIHDLHANIMHLLGIDHTKLTYRFAGRDIRLTDIHGKIIPEIMS